MATDTKTASIQRILLAASQGEPMREVDSVEAISGKGLAGDRYCEGRGYYTGDPIWDAHVTLIAEEAFEAVNTAEGEDYDPCMLRRNLVTRGVDPKQLIGKRFRIGGAVFRGTKEWPPCSYVARLNGRDLLIKHFAYSGGIGANVVESGLIRAGDAIEVLED